MGVVKRANINYDHQVKLVKIFKQPIQDVCQLFADANGCEVNDVRCINLKFNVEIESKPVTNAELFEHCYGMNRKPIDRHHRNVKMTPLNLPLGNNHEQLNDEVTDLKEPDNPEEITLDELLERSLARICLDEKKMVRQKNQVRFADDTVCKDSNHTIQ